VDISAADHPVRSHRFSLVYILRSPFFSATIYARFAVPACASAKSVRRLYAGALWLEREIWDMFGLYFTGNGDLRRLLTDYGFEWSPLRKDFPLCGFLEVFYSGPANKVMYGRLSLAQEYRRFVFPRKAGRQSAAFRGKPLSLCKGTSASQPCLKKMCSSNFRSFSYIAAKPRTFKAGRRKLQWAYIRCFVTIRMVRGAIAWGSALQGRQPSFEPGSAGLTPGAFKAKHPILHNTWATKEHVCFGFHTGRFARPARSAGAELFCNSKAGHAFHLVSRSP
jgi:hypothetical protein